MSLVLLAAPNDNNGNPRRCYVLFNENGVAVGAWEEGYAGCHALPEHLRQTPRPVIQVTATEYKRWLSVARSRQSGRLTPPFLPSADRSRAAAEGCGLFCV